MTAKAKPKFSIIDLLTHAGLENVKVQMLQGSIVNSHENKVHRDTAITFATNALNTTNIATDTGPIGVICWIPRERWPQPLA